MYGKRLAYQVIRIKVVLPTDLSDITIQNNQDLATLVTCTPYMVNTHRLLVTGKRVTLDKGSFDKQEKGSVISRKIFVLFDSTDSYFYGFDLLYH